MRKRTVARGFLESIVIDNHAEAGRPRRAHRGDADFADLFEVKDALQKKGSSTGASRTSGSSSATSARPSCARRGSSRRRRASTRAA